MNNALIYLYIFSGPHLGAKIALNSGKTIIGSEDSADIILSSNQNNIDFAIQAQHALLDIPEDVENLKYITIEELDGKVLIDELAINTESVKIEAGKIFYLGATCMLWNYTGVKQEPVIPKLFNSNKNPENFVEPEQIEDSNANIIAREEVPSNNNIGTLEQIEEAEKKTTKVYKKSVFAYLLLLLLLIILSTYISPKSDDVNTAMINVREKLDNLGFTQLQIDLVGDRTSQGLVVSGIILSEQDRLAIQDMARSLQFPVYLKLEVQDDLITAVQNSLEHLGFYPKLELKDGKLIISAYMQDMLVAESALLFVQEEVENMPESEKNILTAATLSPILEKKLFDEKLTGFEIQYKPGHIAISGDASLSTQSKIKSIFENLSSELNTPIHYSISRKEKPKNVEKEKTVVNDNIMSLLDKPNSEAVLQTKQTQNAETKVEIANNNESIPLLGNIQIEAIILTPLPFIITKDGQRLFEGAILKNGYTIEKIAVDSIVIRKDNEVLELPI